MVGAIRQWGHRDLSMLEVIERVTGIEGNEIARVVGGHWGLQGVVGSQRGL